MKFILGTHETGWIGKVRVPLFYSARRLRLRRELNEASDEVDVDSGGFSELQLYGRWVTPPKVFVREVVGWRAQIKKVGWVACQDWMCEPFMLQKTGLSVLEHQRRTIRSYIELRDLEPSVPWAPVLQGFALDDYVRHLDMYADAGVNLRHAPVVGVGSVCRRQHTEEVAAIFTRLAATGLPLHGFGLKIRGLLRVAPLLASADSLAWSFDARYADPIPGHTHKNCANCSVYALRWRRHVLRQVEAVHGRDLGAVARLLA
jgi:hypothetical protein